MYASSIFDKSNKIQNVDDLLKNIDCICEIAKEDVQKITTAKRLYFYDFDFTYFESTQILKKQLQKTHLRAIKNFLKCENIENAVSFLIQRLLNNMINITTNKNYKNYINMQENAKYFDEEISDVDQKLEEVLQFEALKKISRCELQKGLKKVWEDSVFDTDFDLQDFEELCLKYAFRVEDIFTDKEIYLLKMRVEQTASGSSQLVFVF